MTLTLEIITGSILVSPDGKFQGPERAGRVISRHRTVKGALRARQEAVYKNIRCAIFCSDGSLFSI